MIKEDRFPESFSSMSSPGSDRSKHWSKAAIASLTLAIAGFFSVGIVVGLFLAAIAAVCGHVARHNVEINDLRGGRVAVTGIVIGYLAMLSFPLWVVIAFGTFPTLRFYGEGRNEIAREASKARVESLYAACEDFARENNNRYPTEWDQLTGRYIPGHELRNLLRSPYTSGAPRACEIVPHDRPVLAAIAESLIVIQEIAPATESQIAVVYADGTVKLIHNPDYQ